MPDAEPVRAPEHGGSAKPQPDRSVEPRHLVVLLHGQPGGSEIWQAVQARLAGRPLRLLAVDRPGYGASPLEPGGYRHNAAALVHLIERNGPPAIVVAHSWAAGAAVVAARLAPELVDGLVLCAPVADPSSVTALDRLLGRTRAGRAALRIGLAVGGWLVARPGGQKLLPVAGLGQLGESEAREVSRPARDRRARRAAAIEQTALIEELVEVSRAAPHVRAPTVVLAGSADTVVAPASAASLAGRIPGARLVEVDGGHLLPVEHPGAVADAVVSLVGDGPGRPDA
jgi:pimeloyl-ACP methyl ester carboxylesterase